MNKSVKRIWNIFIGMIMVVVVFLLVALVGVRLVGIQPYVVLSGSMEPTYHTGSLLYVKSVDYKDLMVGDPITYMLSEDVISTHRIVDIQVDPEDPETVRYTTKGDANADVDGAPVHCKNVIGKPVLSIPYLGYFLSYVQQPPGIYYAIIVVVIILFLMFLPEVIWPDENKKSKKKKKADSEEESDSPQEDPTKE